MLPTIKATPPSAWASAAIAVDRSVRALVPSLPAARVAIWHDAPRLHVDRGLPWIVTPYRDDPLRQKDGGYPFPRRVRAELAAIDATGVRFDDLAVAHEIALDGPVRELLGEIPAGGIACDPGALTLLVGQLPPTPTAKRLAKGLDGAVRGAVAAVKGAAVVAGAVLMSPAMMDPIVFGIRHVGKGGPGRPCLWYPLSAWVW